MRPIPANLLPSTMTWRPPADEARGFGGSYGETVTVRRVRFEPGFAKAARDWQVADGRAPAGKVWVDATNSEGEVPCVGALASIDGADEVAVLSVQPFYGFAGRLHHTELEVG